MPEVGDLPPAGWHPDPDKPAQERYWDGNVWTDARRSASPPPQHAAARGIPAQPRAFWLAVGGVALAFVGLFAPWAKALGLVSISGLDTDDGKVLAVTAALAGVCLFRFASSNGRASLITAGLLGVVTCGLSVFEIVDLGGQDFTTVGWGLYLDVIAGAVVAGACAALWRERRRT